MYRTILALITIASVSCAHTAPKIHNAVSFPQFGRQCMQVRQVMCLVDADMTEAQCAAHVLPAIQAINSAAGREVLHFAGNITSATAGNKWREGVYVIMGASLPKSATPGAILLGLTHPERDPKNPECIALVATEIGSMLWDHKEIDVNAVIIHEMLHALGFDHASPDSIYMSIMAAMYNDHNASHHITAADAQVIRFVYGQ